MAHKTLINGTSYEISGGRTLVNGTGYSIDKGKTLVSGTAYEVGFVSIQPSEYLTFSSNSTIALSVASPNWDGTMYYSTDATKWKKWDGGEISANIIYLCGVGNTKVTGNASSYEWTLTGTGISCNGNIETLLDYATVEAGGHPPMANSCYSYMFSGCTGLTSAPSLPATTLADSCYRSMFSGCTELTSAPSLPATTLANYCYRSMFSGCTELTSAPSLPATTLQKNCYQYMFSECTKIKLSSSQTGAYTKDYRIPHSGTGTTASSALSNMFKNTGGTFTGTPSINKTYYLDSSNTIV